MGLDGNNDTIGINIKRYRKERGLTQDDLARETLIQRTTISKYEKGILTPTSDNLVAIENALKLKEGTLARKVAIAIPDTSALMRNKRLLNFLLEDYSQIIIADVVIIELSGFKNARLKHNATAREKRDKKIASQIMSMIEEYKLRYKGKVIQKETKQYDVSKNHGVSEKD